MKNNDKSRVAHIYSIPVSLFVVSKVVFGTEGKSQMAETFRKRIDGVYFNR